MHPPVATKKSQFLEIHGHQRIDDYYWMNDRENPEVINYLEAENAYLKSIMKPTEEFQKALFIEMKGRIKEDDQTVPYFKSGYYWFVRYEKGGEYPIYCRKKGSKEGIEEIILDVNELAKGKSSYQVGGTSTTPNQKILAFAADEVGRRIYTVYFKNLETGEIMEESIPEVTGNFVWAADNLTLFYSKQDQETLRSYRIYKHSLGSDTSKDELIYEEIDPEFSCMVHKSKTEEYLFIHSESTISSEMRFLKSDQLDDEFQILQERIPHLEYAADHFDGFFWIKTNADAQNFKLVKTPISATGRKNWIDVIEHRPDVLLEDFDLFSRYLVTQERSNGLTQIKVKPWGSEGYALKFDDETYTAWVSTNPEFDTDILRFGGDSCFSL